MVAEQTDDGQADEEGGDGDDEAADLLVGRERPRAVLISEGDVGDGEADGEEDAERRRDKEGDERGVGALADAGVQEAAASASPGSRRTHTQ